ncbi:hypothetical protein ILYODFUR_001379 [Ilyodon furcidens]|uniref:Uncharacterized protein n=1 Tax=Ilyodon furcidens TaxID=33524 RepID=A0ABV0STD0_9TELE
MLSLVENSLPFSNTTSEEASMIACTRVNKCCSYSISCGLHLQNLALYHLDSLLVIMLQHIQAAQNFPLSTSGRGLMLLVIKKLLFTVESIEIWVGAPAVFTTYNTTRTITHTKNQRGKKLFSEG